MWHYPIAVLAMAISLSLCLWQVKVLSVELLSKCQDESSWICMKASNDLAYTLSEKNSGISKSKELPSETVS